MLQLWLHIKNLPLLDVAAMAAHKNLPLLDVAAMAAHKNGGIGNDNQNNPIKAGVQKEHTGQASENGLV